MICNFPSFAASSYPLCYAQQILSASTSIQMKDVSMIIPPSSQITLMNLYCGWKLTERKYLICKIDFPPTTSSNKLRLSARVTLFIQLISLMNQTSLTCTNWAVNLQESLSERMKATSVELPSPIASFASWLFIAVINIYRYFIIIENGAESSKNIRGTDVWTCSRKRMRDASCIHACFDCMSIWVCRCVSSLALNWINNWRIDQLLLD